MPNFIDLLSERMQSPGFQMGAGIFSAASSGQDIGSGLLAGSRAASMAREQQMKAEQYRKQQEAEQRQQALWSKLSSGGAAPEWAKSLPPGMLDVVLSMPPEQGSQFVTQMMLKNADRDLDVRRLENDERFRREELALRREQMEMGKGPQFATIGHDAYGNASYGFVDPRKGTVTPAQMPQGQQQGAAAPDAQKLTGEDFLATLDKPIADQVRALAEGRLPVPGSFALKSPYWQRMMSYVSQFDPNFDAINYNARAATRKDFTSGKSAQNITSFNTALGHIDHLDKSIDALGNTRSSWLNSARNVVRRQGDVTYQQDLAKFETAKNAVVEELARAFKGTAGTLTEVEEWAKKIDATQSPEALHSVVKEAVALLSSRINSVGEQYNRGMGTSKQAVDLLTPDARSIYDRLYGSGAAPAPAPSGGGGGGGWGYGGVVK